MFSVLKARVVEFKAKVISGTCNAYTVLQKNTDRIYAYAQDEIFCFIYRGGKLHYRYNTNMLYLILSQYKTRYKMDLEKMNDLINDG